jgi:hypothetical protein
MDQSIAKFSFDFEKKSISKSVMSFLEKHFQSEALKTSVTQVAQGKKLKKDDANMLLQCLFAAVVPEGQEEEEDDADAIFQDSQEVISPNADSQNNQSQIGQSGDSQNSQAPAPASQMCKFYKKGKCRYGKECRNEHPKFCKKFIKHGILKFSPQGCDRKCGKPHPDACRDSLRTKECTRENCRFYHIKGTNARQSKDPAKETKGKIAITEAKEVKEATMAREEKKEGKPEPEMKQAVFLEMEKSMMQKMEQMLHQQMESFMNMVRPQPQWMGLSQRPNPMMWNNS